ncbi:Protein virilizer [Frankliniella fusca]|uniref:Protein virilizer n=1 Tax=Frankliniella fusca TaxID=407009 RepID=A0AAE1LFG8_9NEOP|nr:Protein virilizer [Frankliniella fusca]
MLLWLKDVPSFNIDSIESDQEICDFVDSIVTCSTDNLSDNLVKMQTHHHSHTCYKGRKNSQCRFNIPYYPMRCTTILRPLPEDFPGQQRKKYEKILELVKQQLTDKDTMKMSYKILLHTLNIHQDEYLLAIRTSLSKPQLYLRRDPKDILISPYCKKIIDLMRSNINIQFVLDAFGAATYIIDYINKSNRGMSQILKEVLQQIREGKDSLRKGLTKISNTFYNNSELSIQEACYNILQIPLSKSSEECVFIPTFPMAERVRLVKSQNKLEELDEDSTEIFESGLIEHYANRPDSLKHESLAEFAANFTYSSVHTKTSLPLKNNSGYVTRRSKSRVIRYRNYHYEIDPQNYLRENLMLFMPWTNEINDILDKDMEQLFASHSHTINEKKII